MKALRITVQFCSVILLAGFCVVSASAAGVIYSDLTGTPSAGLGSLGFEAYGAAEFGGIVQPDYTNGSVVTGATVQMVNYACHFTCATSFAGSNGYTGFGNATGYNAKLTLSLYNVDPVTGQVGSLIQSDAITTLIDWATNSPLVQAATFTFAAPVSGDFIYGLSFNTQDYGASPTGLAGPYNSLNVGLTLDLPTTGTNPALINVSGDPASIPSTNYYDSAYWNNQNGLWLSGGIQGVFSQDSQWVSAGWGSGVIAFDATNSPEPATFGLIGFGLLALAVAARKKARA